MNIAQLQQLGLNIVQMQQDPEYRATAAAGPEYRIHSSVLKALEE